MNSAEVLVDTDSGSLCDGRRWRSVAGGYLCELDADKAVTIVFSLGRGSACIVCERSPGWLKKTDALDGWLDWLFQSHPALDGAVFADGTKITRAAFYLRPHPWYRGTNGGRHPLRWVETAQGLRHPERPKVPAGEVYRRHFYTPGMDFSLRRLDLAQDLQRFTNWMNQPRVAEFWEEQGDVDKQRRYIEQVLADPHKDPLIACFDDIPFAYFEVYWAQEDRLGPYYDAEPFDRGLHLLVGETDFLGSRFAHAWLSGIFHFMFLDDDRTRRLVGEPRADNAAILKYIQRMPGWRKVKEFDFPHKRAALVMCEREAFMQGMGVL